MNTSFNEAAVGHDFILLRGVYSAVCGLGDDRFDSFWGET